MRRDERNRAALRRMIDRVSAEDLLRRMEGSLRDVPAYTRFVDDGQALDDRGRVAIRWNIELLLRWLAEGEPPGEEQLAHLRELVRVRAAEGMPMEDGLLVYRRGARIGWDALLAIAQEEERSALLEGVDVLFGYVDMVSDVFAEAYAAESDVPATSAERRARALLDRVAANAPLGPEDHERAARLGFPLADAYRPFVAALVGGTIPQHADMAGRLRAAGALAVAEGPRVAGLLHAPVLWESLGLGGRLVYGEEHLTERGELAVALEDLRALIGLASRAGRRGRVEPHDFLPDLLLQQAPQVADRIVDRVYGPLESGGHAHLAQTVETLVAHGFDRTAAAAALPVHRNTLLYRVGRIEALTGLDFADAADRGIAWLATLRRRARDER